MDEDDRPYFYNDWYLPMIEAKKAMPGSIGAEGTAEGLSLIHIYFGDDGAMKKGWVKTGNDWYYLDPTNGQLHTGWLKIDKNGSTVYSVSYTHLDVYKRQPCV